MSECQKCKETQTRIDDYIIELVRMRQIITAIKMYRVFIGGSLLDAKKFIKGLQG